MQEATRSIALATSEFKASTAGMDNWGKSADGLSAKIKQLDSTMTSQKTILASLEQQHQLVAQEQGENSKGAQDLMIKINNQRAAIGTTEAQLRTYNTKLEDVRKASADVGEETEQTNSALDNLKDTISNQDTELAKLKTAYANVALEQGESSDEAKDLARQIQELSAELAENKNKLSNAEGAADDLTQSLDETGDSAEDSGGGFTVLKGALADLVADGISKVIEGFKDLMTSSDEAMTSFQAKTGASTAEVAKFKGEIEDLYKQNFGESMQDVAEAMAEVKQQTGEIDPSKLKEMTKNALGLRTSLGFDVSESIRTVNQLMKNFGITSDEAFNLIVQGAQAGLNQNDNLLDTIGEYAPKFAMTGGSATDMFNQIKNGAESGVFDVDKLGDAMNEFTTKALAGDADDAFVSLGLAVGDSAATLEKAQGEVDKYQQKVTDLKDKLAVAELKQSGFNSKTSEVTKLQMTQSIQKYNEQLADSEGKLSAATSSVEGLKNGMDSGKMSVDELKQKFAEGGESAQTAFNDVVNALKTIEEPLEQQNLGTALFGSMWEDTGGRAIMAMTDVSGSMDATKSSMDELNNVSGSTLSGELAGIGRSLKMDLLQPLVDQALPAIKNFANGVKNELPKVKDLFVGVGKAISDIVPYVVSVGAAVATYFVVTQVMTFAKAIKSGAVAVKLLAAKQAILNAVMSLNPIGAVIAAIAGLVLGFSLLWNKSESFRNFWIGLWNGIKSAFTPVISAIVNFFTVTIPAAFTSAVTFLGGIVNSIVNFFTVTIPTAFTSAVAAVGNFVSGVINFFVTLPERISTLLQTVISAVVTWVSNMVAKAVEVGSQFVSNVIQFLSKLPSKMGFLLGTVIGTVLKFGINLIKFATTEIPKFVNNVIKFISQLPSKFWTWLTSTISKVVAWGANLISTGKQKASDFISGVINFIKELPSKFATFLSNVITNVVSWGTNLINTGKTKATSFVTSVVNFVKQLPAKLLSGIQDAIQNVVTWGTNLAEKGTQAASDLLNAVVNGVASLPGRMVEIGGNIVSGVWNGIQNAAGQFTANVRSFFSGIVDGVKNALGIHSPSRVFRDEVGKQIVEGIKVGISRQTASAVNTMSNLCKNLLKTALRANWNYKSVGSSAVKAFEDGFKTMLSTSSANMQKLIDDNYKKYSDKLDAQTQARIDKRTAEVEAENKVLKSQINKNNREQINEQMAANKKNLNKEISQIKSDTKKKKEEYAKSGKSVITAYSAAMEKAAEKVKNSLSNKLNKIAEETQEKYDEIAKMQEEMNNKLSGYGELFTRDDEGNVVLGDMNKDIDTLKTYGNNISKLKGKISDELMTEIAGMSVEDAKDYTQRLLQMSDQELSEYNKLYAQKLNTAKSIAKAFYKEKVDEIKTEYTDKVNKAFKDVEKQLKEAGINAIQGFINGMTKNGKKNDKEIKKIADNIVKTMKKALKIHSPSKVFEQLGMFSGMGYINGFKESIRGLAGGLSTSVQQSISRGRQPSIGSNTVKNINYNFYQTNNSPKALSRVDIYRQTKNQLSFAKGV